MNTGQTTDEQRMNGTVLATFPDRGFFWVKGTNGQKFFAHAVQVQNDWNILDMWEGQECTFVPGYSDPRGPNAIQIQMKEPRA